MLHVAIKIAGLIFLGYAAAHPFFPSRFRWREELARLSLLNRQIFMVHTGFIVLILILLGVLCVGFTSTLLDRSPMSGVLLYGLEIFCVARLFVQLFVYDSALWKGHAFNTKMHIFFVTTWSYLVIVFTWALSSSR